MLDVTFTQTIRPAYGARARRDQPMGEKPTTAAELSGAEIRRKLEAVMAKTYTKLNGWFWWDPSFQQLGASAKLVYLFLRTHPHTSMIGALRATLTGLISEMGETEALFLGGFEGLVKAGLVRHEAAVRLLILPGYVLMEENRPANQNVVKGWVNEIQTLPDCQLTSDLAVEILRAIALLPLNFTEDIDLSHLETVSKPFRNRLDTVSKPVAVAVSEKEAVAVEVPKLSDSTSSKQKEEENNADLWDDDSESPF